MTEMTQDNHQLNRINAKSVGSIKSITRVFLSALILRCLMLLIVYISGPDMNLGFLGPHYTYDDVRYQLGAESFANSANSLVDLDAFTSSFAQYGDWTGYYLQDNPLSLFTNGCFWYLFICYVTYVTGTFWVVRFLNALFGALTTIYVYRFVQVVRGERIALLAASLYAFLPYPVIFCCFGYKDQLIGLITFYLLNWAVLQRYGEPLGGFGLIKALCAALILLMLRSGITVLFIAICLIIALTKRGLRVSIDFRSIVFIVPLALIILYLCHVTGILGTISYKLSAYIAGHERVEGGTGISLVLIRSARDLYKLPFALVYAAISPFSLFIPFTTWANIVSTMNTCMIPVALAASAHFFRPKSDKLIYWLLVIYLCITLITSINVFRHYYSLLPFYLMWASEFFDSSEGLERTLIIFISICILLAFIVYYA